MTYLAAAIMVLVTLGCRNSSAERRPKHLIVLTIDTLRQDRVGVYGYPRPTSPTIDSLAARGVRFDDAITQAVLTPASHATMFTGLNPPTHGLQKLAGQALAEDRVTLAEVLESRGFETAAFVSGLPLRSELGLDQGFDFYEDSFKDGAAERTAAATNDEVERWLVGGRRGGPLFLWVHYFDPHYMYRAPRDVRAIFGIERGDARVKRVNVNPRIGDPSGEVPAPEMVDRGSRLYDAEIRFTDDQIGRLLEKLRIAGILQDAIIVVVADHGESLGEHGYYFGHWDVRRETAVVPLILVHPYKNDWAGRVVDQPVGAIDIMPTILGWLGLERPRSEGIDLTPAIEGEPLPERLLYTERGGMGLSSVRTAEWLYVRLEARATRPAVGVLYDRAFGEERREPALSDRFASSLDGFSRPSSAEHGSDRAISEEIEERLRALGYNP